MKAYKITCTNAQGNPESHICHTAESVAWEVKFYLTSGGDTMHIEPVELVPLDADAMTDAWRSTLSLSKGKPVSDKAVAA